jgi:hypothetical protein
MYLKIMSDDNLPDDDLAKNFSMQEIEKGRVVHFRDSPEHPDERAHVYVDIVYRGVTEESFRLYGNAYLMNDQGKTIDRRVAYTVKKLPSGNPVDFHIPLV